MTEDSSNVCIRCGKVRIVSKTWTEKIDTFFGQSEVTYTETVCPDPACQKIVEEKIKQEKEKKEALQQEREERLKRTQEKSKRKKS